MDQVETIEQEQVIAQPEVALPQTEASHEIEAQPKPPEEKSWVNRLRRERDEAVREAKMAKELAQQLMTMPKQQAQPQVVEEDVISEIEREEYVPGQKVAKAIKSLKQDFSKQVQEIEQRYAQKAINDQHSELLRQFPDLTEVVNHETLAMLKETNPLQANALAGKSDYEIYVLAYPLIKNSSIMDEIKGVRRASEVDKKIEQNKKTVPSPQTFDKRPMAQAFNYDRLSKSQKDELQKEMYGYAALASGAKPIG